jgi:hypothetical protein
MVSKLHNKTTLAKWLSSASFIKEGKGSTLAAGVFGLFFHFLCHCLQV